MDVANSERDRGQKITGRPLILEREEIMIKRVVMASVFLWLVSYVGPAQSGPNMKEGLWEITSKVNVPGMQLPAHTVTQCLTSQDLVPKSSQPNTECRITDSKVVGDTVSWTMKCSGQGGEMTATGRITYHGDSFNGSMEMTMSDGGMKMVTTMSGRRIGDCP